MIKFFAPSFAVVIGNLRAATVQLTLRRIEGRGERLYASIRSLDESILGELESELADVALSPVVRRSSERAISRLRTDGSLTVSQAEIIFQAIHNDVISDLTTSSFLMIQAEKKRLYDAPEPLFGAEVANRFVNANSDIAAAGRCLALDEWTAAVFHLMRVLEIGLRAVAAKIEVPMNSSVDLENWKNIIDQIEKRIRDFEQMPKSQSKSETLQFYSQSAANFRYFKDAWRNHVSHSRATYDERAAMNVWNHVRQFMTDLATMP